MRVLIVGDVHGQQRELAEKLRQVQTDYRIEAGIQAGDFGFYENRMAETVRYPVPLHVIDGNHEDHRWLRRALRRDAADVWKKERNLIYQPRPSVARLGVSKVGFMGGALHVDRPQKHNLLSGLPNYILRRHREQAVALFNREKPDLIVTHSCPSGIGIGVRGSADLEHGVAEHIRGAGFDAGPQDDCGEAELAELWRGLCYRPRGWVFGHFHSAHDVVVEGTRFVCVAENVSQPLVLWDTEEKRLLTVRR
jgi:hypothetical protein